MQALDIIEGLTGSAEGAQALRGKGKDVCAQLFRCVSDFTLARTALTALVNLSQDPYISRDMLAAGACNRIMDYIREDVTSHHDMLLMMLSNLTIEEVGSKQMLQARPRSCSAACSLHCTSDYHIAAAARSNRVLCSAFFPVSAKRLWQHGFNTGPILEHAEPTAPPRPGERGSERCRAAGRERRPRMPQHENAAGPDPEPVIV